jgi:hypothetical protein
VETEQAKIYHHHTPREYLLPWADADERIAWLGYGKVHRSGLTVVGGENDFYKLKHLTDKDIDKIRKIIAALPKGGRKGHEDLLRCYVLPTRLKRDLESRIVNSQRLAELAALDETQIAEEQIKITEAKHLLEVTISNLNENYHASIERRFWPYLASIRRRDFSFYEDPLKAGEFLHGLSVQYLRTKTVKDRVSRNVELVFEDIERVWDLLSHIYGVVMGASIFADRRRFKIVVLENDTEVPFITSDQPIINMLSDPKDFSSPTRMELYYPLSPSQAMLFLEKSTPVPEISLHVSIDEAHRYNRMMLDHSGLRIFSNSEEYLLFLKRFTDLAATSPKH